ncbi:hypothetical protein N7478_009841 [Penicillium angulare]|uniref:uncharacterized protein n=1 Tax=Penicillium angulare TaxID=116970 RepID=UPI002540E5F0|nr:uncharacterized protein N7478_009841 [Penicillium angulare]KAJ5267033.1 hypothetical protein N7478_009841 [Penicillium angulare]
MDDVQATAKWANRMLRPLTSIYRRLEKHHETLAIIAAESKVQSQHEESPDKDPESSQSAGIQEIYSGSDADEGDPVWIPEKKKPDQRRVRHRYSAREEKKKGRKRARLSIHSPEVSRTLPGTIELATPLITGRRWEMPSSAQSQPPVEQPRQSQNQEQQAFRDRYSLHKNPWQELINQSEDAGFVDIVRNLDRVLQNFLYNTRVSGRSGSAIPAKPRLGARSLLFTVMRRLPEFIAIEEKAQNELGEDGDEDMCDAYFTELESFYAPHGKGWKPLRQAVRAQGLYMVSILIRNEWLTDAIICALIDKCRHSEPDACESLLSTFLSTRTSYPAPVALKSTPDTNSPGNAVRLLHKYAYHESSRRSYIFDELSKLLARGVLPPEWMATKPWTHWMERATISFSRGDDDCATASRLIEAVLFSAGDVLSGRSFKSPRKRSIKHEIGRFTRNSSVVLINDAGLKRKCPVPVEDALNNQVTSLLAALCGMHISRSREFEDVEDAGGTEASHIVNYVSSSVENEMNTKPLSKASTLSSHHLLRRGCILLADCLLRCNDAILTGDTHPVLMSTDRIEEWSDLLVSRSALIKELALFVRRAFRCFGSTSNGENTYMGAEIRRIVSRLPYLTEAPGLAMFLGRVAVEAAMEFAESTGEPEDHLWAVEIQETIMALRNDKVSSSGSKGAPKHNRGLYRWEDTIGEWVARTPAAKPNPHPIIGRKRRASELSMQSPCIPCSTDSSSSDSDGLEKPASSVTSSPSSIGTTQHYEVPDTSPIKPFKRRRTAPVVITHDEDSASASPSDRSTSRSPSLEPVPSHRRVLRDLSNRMPKRSAAQKPAPKVEVVIIKDKAPRPSPAQPPSENMEKQINRSMDRRRPGRPSISKAPVPVVVPRRRSVIPCSQDDSDDELSFM